MNFALKLKELREEKGITQVKLAEIFSVSKGAVGLWETGQRVPKAEQLLKIANFFGVSVSELLGEHDNAEENHVEVTLIEKYFSYGEKIASIRKSLKLSVRKFAKLVGCSYTYIPQLERGISSSNKPLSPTIEILMNICDKTGYDFALFLAETGYLNPDRVCMNDDEVKLLQAFRGNYSNDFMEIANNMSEKVEKRIELKE